MACIICEGASQVIKSCKGLKYCICKNCGHIYQEDNRSAEYYQDLPYESQWSDYENHSRNRASYIYEFCKDHIKENSTHLDVGCGRGGPMFFLNKKFLFKECTGCTVDADQKKYHQDLNIMHEDFLNLNPSVKYDFVTMVHVLEHFPSPIAALLSLRKITKENGFIYIEVPSYTWGRRRSPEFFCEVHLSYFTYKYLLHLLRNMGFTVVKKKHSKYWGNIKILLSNHTEIPKENYLIKSLINKFLQVSLFPFITFIQKIKK